MQSRPEFIYHYTDSTGLDGILQAGIIRATEISDRDACHGRGVYLTVLDPSRNSKEAILRNNYNRTGRGNYGHEGRADCYIKFRISDLKAEKQLDEKNRDVWIYRGPIILKDYQCWYSLQRSEEDFVDCAVSDDDEEYDDWSSSYHSPSQPAPSLASRRPASNQQAAEESSGLGTAAIATGATVAAIGLGLGIAAIFGAFRKANNNRQQ